MRVPATRALRLVVRHHCHSRYAKDRARFFLWELRGEGGIADAGSPATHVAPFVPETVCGERPCSMPRRRYTATGLPGAIDPELRSERTRPAPVCGGRVRGDGPVRSKRPSPNDLGSSPATDPSPMVVRQIFRRPALRRTRSRRYRPGGDVPGIRPYGVETIIQAVHAGGMVAFDPVSWPPWGPIEFSDTMGPRRARPGDR
jgi:hypothetical protein